jgi:hypothetical protein
MFSQVRALIEEPAASPEIPGDTRGSSLDQ